MHCPACRALVSAEKWRKSTGLVARSGIGSVLVAPAYELTTDASKKFGDCSAVAACLELEGFELSAQLSEAVTGNWSQHWRSDIRIKRSIPSAQGSLLCARKVLCSLQLEIGGWCTIRAASQRGTRYRRHYLTPQQVP